MLAKRIMALLLASVIFLSACSDIIKNKPQETKSFFAMDTYITVSSYEGGDDNTVDEVEKRISRLEKLWSVTDKDSEIYRLDHSTGKSISVSDETVEIVRFALDMSKRTDGALDISLYPVLTAWGFTTGENRVPDDKELEELLKKTGWEKIKISENNINLPQDMQIDLGSVAKGFAGDITSQFLKEKGVTSALIDLGGNIQTIGLKPDGSKWKIGVKDPLGEGSIGTLEVGECAVVTSGGYERFFEQDGEKYWHILDPKDGKPARSGIASVTIIGKEGKLCDALSTSMFVKGRKQAEEFWRNSDDFEMIIVEEDGEIYVTNGIKDDFSCGKNVHVIS